MTKREILDALRARGEYHRNMEAWPKAKLAAYLAAYVRASEMSLEDLEAIVMAKRRV